MKSEPGQRRRRFSTAIPRVTAVAAVLAVVSAGLVAVLAPAANAATNFTATISPTTTTAGHTDSYTVTVTNSKTNLAIINSLTLTIPAAYTASSHTVTSSQLVVLPGATTTLTATATAPTTAGTYNWSVAASSLLGGNQGTVTLPVVVTAAPATHLAYVQQPTNTDVTHAITPAVSVEALDQYGNVATAYSTPITLGYGVSPSGANPPTGNTATPSSGVATFPSLTITTMGNGYTLVASSGSLTSATSTAFNVAGSVVQCPANNSCDSGNITTTQNETFSNGVTAPITTTVNVNAASGPQNDVLTTSVGAAPALSCGEFGATAATTVNTRSKTITYTLQSQNIEDSEADEHSGYDVSDEKQVCYGSSIDFVTNTGAMAGPGTVYPYEGILPNCNSKGTNLPCLQSHQDGVKTSKLDTGVWVILAAAGDPGVSAH